MSKESRKRDLWRHVGDTRPDPKWCKGCGHYPIVNAGAHRADCTAEVKSHVTT
jgi:pyruvate/2-oxoacid:ferredoxin oxidoreductase beta subunit